MSNVENEVITTIHEKEKSYPIREKDLFEFKAWGGNKTIKPDLLSEFETDADYERFMLIAEGLAGITKALRENKIQLPNEIQKKIN